VCAATKWFWNVCARQSRGVHDNNQFKVFSWDKQLEVREILQELALIVKGVRCTLKISLTIQLIQFEHIWKFFWKTRNFVNTDKIRCDFNMNKNKVVIKNCFWFTKE
jgi:hypothetical protein